MPIICTELFKRKKISGGERKNVSKSTVRASQVHLVKVGKYPPTGFKTDQMIIAAEYIYTYMPFVYRTVVTFGVVL